MRGGLPISDSLVSVSQAPSALGSRSDQWRMMRAYR